MFNYRWREGSDKPQEDFKDMADCVRYAAMEQPLYRSPQNEGFVAAGPKAETYNPLYYGLSLR